MKKNKLIILSSVLAVLLVMTIGTKLITQKKEKIKETGDSILSLEASDVDSLEILYGSYDYLFVKEDGTWYYDKDKKLPIDQDEFLDLLSYYDNVYADFEISDVSNYSQYGLSNPKITVIATVDDDTYEIKAGNLSNSDSERYICLNSGNVYLAKLDPYEEFYVSPEDFIKLEEIPSMDKLVSLSLENDSSVFEIVYKEDAGYCYSDEFLYYLKDGDEYKELDNNLAKTFVNLVRNLNLTSYVTYTASDDGLASYGLDKDYIKCCLKYIKDDEEKEFVFLISEKSGNYYGMFSGSEIVYYIAANTYNSLHDAKYEDLLPEDLLLLDWDEAKSIDILLDDETFSFKLDGSEKDDDGKEISFTSLTNAIDDIAIEEYSIEAASKKQELSLVIYLKSGEELELAFYKYDAESCLVTWNGEGYALVKRSSVVTLIEKCNSYIL